MHLFFFFFSSRRRHTRWPRDWSSDVCSSDLQAFHERLPEHSVQPASRGVCPEHGTLVLVHQQNQAGTYAPADHSSVSPSISPESNILQEPVIGQRENRPMIY